ncbi:conjugal transfer protein TraI [Pedobacter frigoris]|uniref:conjugal transfer protein TraI n=1 Tax=Pedobacter frigoris TaxID=2571272 RepID=UPI00292EB1D7|nr:conjugal transfer protein TraI [Pedobacter frigoris]
MRKRTKKSMALLACVVLLIIAPAGRAEAQIIILDVIKAGVKKVIKAIDLQIQRQQNKVIWMQNAQKTLENTMSKLKLTEITGWVEKQKNLYQDYYQELAKVKSMITSYQRIREIIQKQAQLMEEYKHVWALLKKDERFTAKELDYMAGVYSGILAQSVENIDQISLVISAFATTMGDAKRLEIINAAADKVDENLTDLTRFSNQNMMLSLHRAKDADEIKEIKKWYGLE